MIKKTINYTDYDGNVRTEDFYFHLNKAELVKMNLSAEGGSMERMLERISQTQDVKRVYEIVEDIVDRSYGVKTLDGKRFVKNQDLLNEFKETEAYSELMVELLSEESVLVAFINGIIPQDIAEEAAKHTLK